MSKETMLVRARVESPHLHVGCAGDGISGYSQSVLLFQAWYTVSAGQENAGPPTLLVPQISGGGGNESQPLPRKPFLQSKKLNTGPWVRN